ncbi:nitrite and sulfite reductase 4Fe-4S domain family protein [Pleurotus pulmonarius]
MAAAAVARITYLTSDVVVEARSSPSHSLFAETYATVAKSSHHEPTIVQLPIGADVGAALVRNSGASIISLSASSSSQLVSSLVLHLPEISSQPVVLSIAVTDDLSDVLLLRSAAPFFLVSTTGQQAHDNALLAARLARAEHKAVIHAFYVQRADEPVIEIPTDEVLPFLMDGKRGAPSHVSNGLANVPVNGGIIGRTPTIYTPETSSGETSPEHAITDDLALLENFKSYESASLATHQLTHRTALPFTTHSSPDAHTVVFTVGKVESPLDVEGVTFVQVSLINPLLPSRILASIPSTAKTVIVLEHVWRWSMKWPPLYLEVASSLQQLQREHRPAVYSGLLGDTSDVSRIDVLKLVQQVSTDSPIVLGSPPASPSATLPHVPTHELSYTKVLTHVFADRLEISNSPSLVESHGELATTPEFALGRIRAQLQQREELVESVQELLQDNTFDTDLHALLSKWVLAKDDQTKSRTLGAQLVEKLLPLEGTHPTVDRILALQSLLPATSKWIIGSDAWSYDIGASGLHHVIASGLNINILILDTLPYSARNTADPNRRKHDVGLYAMNHGDVYVASVAVYASYSHVLQAIAEADRFNGPSVVLAYLPYQSESTPALDILKETKLAVDAGYWPLYRWNPTKEAEGQEPFSLDSAAIKNELQQFLDRQNHLSQLVRSKPQIASELVSSLGENVKEARRKHAQKLFDDMLTALDAPPLLILYASDGGTAEKKAKRLARRATARGLSTTINTVDSISLDGLSKEEHVVFVISTAGQGEPTQNARTFFKALNAAVAQGEQILTKLRYSVFGMGDSHYWPRPEDAHYYNKPGKDLDARLEKLGAQRLADLGLGDDQDADGPETGYKEWEPRIWKALGVDSIEVTEIEPDPITNEHIKAASGYLRGTIAEGLQDATTGALAASDTQLTKFHGIYQQDDRDIRDERQAQGVEPAYSFMIRVRMPGGVCLPNQWLQMDQIADEHGSGTFKITTRQTFQFHGVIKRHLKPAIQDINRVLLDTLAACGDVNRNVVCSSIPSFSKLHTQVYEFSKGISAHLVPRTTAYHEIWLDKKLVAGEALKDVEPLYGEFYLPRKFKVAVAVPPTNDVDVFANDLGFIAIVDGNGELAGFNVTVGGGMGVTHGNKKTYPRLGDIIGFCTYEQGKKVAEAVMLTQRDNGNRAEYNARLKYTIDRMGLDVFKAEVEKRLGYPLAPPRPYTFDRNVDDFGWSRGEDGRHHFTMFIENGRIQDEPGRDFKTGLREVAKVLRGSFRLTTNQHLLISDIPTEDVPAIKAILAKYKMDNLSQTGLRLSSSACVAFPTCGLAMAESERYLPILVDKLEKICEENGLRNDSIIMRMTGCPNGCARPYVAEIAFIGKAPGTYSMLLGGGYYGQRLNKIYRESVTEPEILAILKPMIKRYALERQENEKFGDWTIRAGYISATTSGIEWYEGMGGEGQYREVVA